MALETVSISLTEGAYTVIGTNVTNLSAVSPTGKPFSIHAVAAGSAAPTDPAISIPIRASENGQFQYSSVAADIYAYTTFESATLKVMRS